LQQFDNILTKSDVLNRINEKESKPKMIVSVKDNGVGMEKEFHDKLFKMFGTLRATGEVNTSGIGLGLFVCKSLLSQFNGFIYVKSEKDIGSTFTFSIEISNEQKQPHNANLSEIDLEAESNLVHWTQ